MVATAIEQAMIERLKTGLGDMVSDVVVYNIGFRGFDQNLQTEYIDFGALVGDLSDKFPTDEANWFKPVIAIVYQGSEITDEQTVHQAYKKTDEWTVVCIGRRPQYRYGQQNSPEEEKELADYYNAAVGTENILYPVLRLLSGQQLVDYWINLA